MDGLVYVAALLLILSIVFCWGGRFSSRWIVLISRLVGFVGAIMFFVFLVPLFFKPDLELLLIYFVPCIACFFGLIDDIVDIVYIVSKSSPMREGLEKLFSSVMYAIAGLYIVILSFIFNFLS